MQLNNFRVEYHSKAFGSKTGGFIVYGLRNENIVANSAFTLDAASMNDIELICDFITTSINEIIHFVECGGCKDESMSKRKALS